MAKKKLKAPRGPSKKEHNQRISYLYQAGAVAAKTDLDVLSRAILRKMDLVAKKAVIKLHPNIKRTVCKGCSRILAENSEIRLVNPSKDKSPENDVLEVKCVCGKIRRYPVGKNRSYELFSERKGILYNPGEGPESD